MQDSYVKKRTKIKYCEPTFIPLREICARALSLQIFLAVNQSLRLEFYMNMEVEKAWLRK